MKMRYTTLFAAALATISPAWGADAGSASPSLPAAMPLPPQPASAPVFAPNPAAVSSGPMNATPPSAAPTIPVAPATNMPVVTSAASSTTNTDPKVGDTASSALLALGRPNGQIDLPDQVIYIFPRGRLVVSADGLVKEVDLKPLAEFQAIQAADAQDQADKQSTEQLNHTRANALLDLLLHDPSYLALSTRDRLLALKKFDRDHPGSDEAQFYKDLLAIYQAEYAVQTHSTELQNQNKQAMSQTAILQKQLADDEKALAALKQRTTQADIQAIQATISTPPQAAPAPEQVLQPLPSSPPPPLENNNGGPVGKSGVGAVVITAGGGVNTTPSAPRQVDVNGTLQNPPNGSYWVMQPDGSLKLVSP